MSFVMSVSSCKVRGILVQVDLVRQHYSDIIMGAVASQITGVSIVCSIVCSGADQRKRQSSVSLVFGWGESIGHRWIPP